MGKKDPRFSWRLDSANPILIDVFVNIDFFIWLKGTHRVAGSIVTKYN